MLGKDVLKLQYFTEADLNRYVRILLLTSNQIGVQVWKSILFIRYLSNRTEETDEDCRDLRRRLDDFYARGDNGLGEGPAASTSKLTITCNPGSFPLARKFEGMSPLVKITMESHSRYFFEKLHCDQLELIGAGTYGNVFSLLKDGQKLGVVMKLFAEVTKRELAMSVAGNDAAAAAYERILQKGKDMMRNTRIDLPPFAVLSADTGGPVGITFFPTETSRGEFGMTALFMEEGVECAQPEVESLARRFKDPNGRVKKEDWMQVASFMSCFLSSLQSMHAQGISNCDVKPANYVWFDATRKSGPIYYLGRSENSQGRKVTGAFIDFGMGKFPKIEYLSDSDYKSATSVTHTLGDARRSAGILRTALDDADSTSGTKTAATHARTTLSLEPYQVTPLELHQRMGCVPSLKTSGPLRPQRAGKAGGTSGCMPPESTPSAVDGRYPGFAWQKIDVFAAGMTLVAILNGTGHLSQRVTAHDRQDCLITEAEPDALWHTFLNKTSLPTLGLKDVPPDWVDAIDLVRCLTRKDPDQTLALQHPFIKSLERYMPDQPKRKADHPVANKGHAAEKKARGTALLLPCTRHTAAPS